MKKLYFTLFFTLFLLPLLAFAQEATRLWDGTDFNTIRMCGSAGALDVAIVDGSGNQITSFGSSTVTANQGVPGTPWPITVSALPLPTGAATETTLSALNGKVTACNTGAVAGSVTCNAGTNLNTSTLATNTELGDKLDEATFTGRIGEVQASPTANTLLARLKDLLTGIVLAAGANTIGTVNNGQLIFISSASYDIDNSSVQIFNTDGVDSTTKAITIANAGTGDLFCRVGGSAPVADGSTAYYDFKLALGETRWLPVGYKVATSVLNDVYCLRAAAQTNDNVIVGLYAWAN
jgi:hypothetical protein